MWTCKHTLSLSLHTQQIARAPELFVESMTQLSTHLKSLEHFLDSPEKAISSVLLEEVGYPAAIATPPTVDTPIFHCLMAVNEFIQLFVHLAKASQAMYNVRRENVSNSLGKYLVHFHIECVWLHPFYPKKEKLDSICNLLTLPRSTTLTLIAFC